jgi:glycosyltransferase involved in cell wall biosynthesis
MSLPEGSMKVLVLHSELGVLRGGGENFTKNLFTAFAARGHHVTAAFVADRSAHYPIPLPPSIEPIPIRGWWSRNLGQTILSTVGRRPFLNGHLDPMRHRLQEAVSWRVIRWHNRRFQRKVRQELTQRFNDFDLVYVHGDVDLAAEMADSLPTVLRLPGPVSDDCSELLQKVHIVCANGDALSRVSSFLPKGVMELPIGIDGKRFQPGFTSVRQNLGWSESDLVVGYVGRLTHVKGVDLLAAAFREASRSLPDLRLLIVGRGEATKSIRSFLAEETRRGIVRIQPDVGHEQLPEWYRAMDLFVMPSRYENYSNAILEAMACGIPFLASDIGGNKSLADTGSGWLFKRESACSLTLCLGKIRENRPEMKFRGQSGSKYVRGRYSWAASAERLEWIIAAHLGVKG